ncbi:uncharacterized protein Z518_10615 [Rhinocladiella mackenziei CBS 650.93]|uniref:F-box domain-containing protein n=1 Tax=Rhinocladiella mackenziei CBS 650.93 TaxID=1442369 RepID=A0A0D2IUT5_9EURO|nr:uncharacterized protein Z518_10615 [Rhinocladiella mackenziei CBS 650.93]KIX00475.1 hypothetical protein Z518_10615 [Rhinocladiella mackenziei CBS 650.93]
MPDMLSLINSPAGPIPRLSSSSSDDGEPLALEVIKQLRGRIAPREPPSQPQDSLSRPDSYEPFFIPHPILFESPTTSQNGSALLQMPSEILTLIFQQVNIPYFQVCLALTCKDMGRIASKKNVMSSWRGYRDKDGLFRLLERKHYIPQSLRLCRACFRFVPRSAGYWVERMMHPAFDRKSANWYDIFNWFNEQSHAQHRCPWCCILGYTSYFTERSYLRERAFLGDGERSTMCPELNRRMDRP